jgi:methylenetetrahydrofolate--tRNA-(uracil-5-)-methyltransferase
MARGCEAARRPLVVVGAGLAGCEAAWQAARRGVAVTLYEMKPQRFSPAHSSPDFAELVCSNSLRSNVLSNAVGLLKEEMRRLGSLVLTAADEVAVPAGRALAVDRVAFARRITEALTSHPGIEVRHEALERIPEDDRVVLATGPLTAPELAQALRDLLGEEHLYFYDALSPIVHADSIDHDVAFRASRYEDGGDYLNLPLSEAEYDAFVDALLGAETVPLHPFEASLYFEGCLPLEEMARRGRRTLAYGPMKPVGLVDPRSGRRPFAVVQLRQEDKRGVLYNLVGFQTKLRIGEQRRVLRQLPGLREAVFARFGSVHRNTYVNAPRQLTPELAGVEGYVESAALGYLAGLNAVWAARGEVAPLPPETTAHGALIHHLMNADAKRFQPMNVNYGLFPPLAGERVRSRRERQERMAQRALEDIEGFRARADALLS